MSQSDTLGMPWLAAAAPLIGAVIGAGTSLYSGYRADQRNQQAIGQANQATQAQQALIAQLMSGISPAAYQAQAAQATQSGLSQLAANFAGRGMLSSGALHTAGADLATRAQTDAMTRYQQDRMNAIDMALGGQQAIQRQYAGQVNPDPYAGLGTALGAVGTAGAGWLGQRYGTPSPGVYGGGTPLPGFGVRYPGGLP